MESFVSLPTFAVPSKGIVEGENISAVGILLGFAFIEPQDIQDIHAQMAVLMNEYDINLPQLPDFDFSRLEAEWGRFRSSIPEVWKFNNDGREFQVGEQLKERGLSAKHPVILIPGIISTVRRRYLVIIRVQFSS